MPLLSRSGHPSKGQVSQVTAGSREGPEWESLESVAGAFRLSPWLHFPSHPLPLVFQGHRCCMPYTPICIAKAVKNSAESEGMRRAHVSGAACAGQGPCGSPNPGCLPWVAWACTRLEALEENLPGLSELATVRSLSRLDLQRV